MPTHELRILVGIPASGKSTYAVERRREGWAVVSSDEVRASVTGDAGDVSRDAEVWPLVEGRVEGALLSARDVIVDATNLLPDKRATWLRIARSWGAQATAVRFPVLLAEARGRNAARDRKVPEDVMVRMYDDWVAWCSPETLAAEGFAVLA